MRLRFVSPGLTDIYLMVKMPGELVGILVFPQILFIFGKKDSTLAILLP